jgi:hypothetical protein
MQTEEKHCRRGGVCTRPWRSGVSPSSSGQATQAVDAYRSRTRLRPKATARQAQQAHRRAASRMNAVELMQVVDFQHPRGFRLFSGRSGVFPSIGGGIELQKVKSSAWARLGSLKTAWARLARGCREMIFARKWGYGDASDPKRRQAKRPNEEGEIIGRRSQGNENQRN